MAVSVRVPAQLRSLTKGLGEIEAQGSTLAEVIKSLDSAYPGLADRLLDEEGRIRRFVNVFVADEDVRFLSGLDTPIAPGQAVSILPAVAGG
ncbi:MAG: MoaD/ThiS family protein [Acidimicrobiales bacterium]